MRMTSRYVLEEQKGADQHGKAMARKDDANLEKACDSAPAAKDTSSFGHRDAATMD